MINPKLKIGDRVVLLHMDGESIPVGTKGTVGGESKVFGDVQYSVKWDNGSTLALISSCDAWQLESKMRKKVEEVKIIKKKSITESNESLFQNHEIFKFFNMRFLHNYLKMVRDSGIVNMFGAAPYLYIGREKIEHEFKYKDFDSDEFEKVLENADQAQHEMINGVIKILESQNKEVSIENVNRALKRYAPKVLTVYMSLH